ncbi:MAG: glycosyl transferase family 1, partial [Paucimonas sp.]|nr:glycosyl transferase family 1 [Paucimonas sp.]
MLAHNGWGEPRYLKDVFPSVPLVEYCECQYRLRGADVGFDPELPETLCTRSRLRTEAA